MSNRHWTYEDLRNWINSMTDEQRSMSITIHDDETDEYYGIRRCWIANEDDILSKNSPVITF